MTEEIEFETYLRISPKIIGIYVFDKKKFKNLYFDEKSYEIKTENLRISKSNELKPEIKKVKKQETEKREYKIKDYILMKKVMK